MNVSTRFTMALHILTLLSSSPDEALTSEHIAASVNTIQLSFGAYGVCYKKRAELTQRTEKAGLGARDEGQ